MLAAGSVIAGYRIERVLGSGGMGSVYLAHSPELPRLDALKVLSSAYGTDPEFRARFLREADVAAALDHPNIVAIYRRGETADGQLWIAMQFVEGTDADAALKAGTMTPQRAVRIVGEVAKALDYAHRRNVVHRDVKPANFLLTASRGATERVLLGDFGIARGLDDVGLTSTGSMPATMAYAAPEVLAGLRFDGRADIYSLGCSLFRLVSGNTPFSAGNGPAALLMAHLHQPPPRITDQLPRLPPALDRVIATAMAKDPAQRFATAAELAAAAQTALRDAPSGVSRAALPAPAVGVRIDRGWSGAPTPPPGTARPVPRNHRLRRVAATLAAITVAVGAAAAVVLSGRHAQAPASSARSPSPTVPPTAAAAPGPAPVADLPSFLLSSPELGVTLGTAHLQIDSTSTTLLDSSTEVTEKECVSAWAPAQAVAYANSGEVGAQIQVMTGPGDPAQRTTLTQAVIAFPSSNLADNAVTAQIGQWQPCANRTITVTMPGSAPTQLDLGAVIGLPGAWHTMSQQPESMPGQHCQRAVGSKNNVVIDVVACSPSVQDPARSVGRMIADKVPSS
jgi:hypothetical protein